MTQLAALRNRYGEAIDQAVNRWLTDRVYPAGLRQMLQYQFGYVDKDGRPAKQAGGKRFRPILCLLACDATGGDWRTGLDMAAAIELLHNFSLIHDDIEDRDPARHHRPTVWKVWGEAQAINAGDAMFALAGRVAAHAAADSSRAWEIIEAFQDTVQSLTQGQYLDLSFETREDVSVAEYQEMVGLKTGALIAFSLWAGAAMAGAEASTLEPLLSAGLHLGIGFQALDDVRGVWANETETGKVAGKDIENRKRSLPVVLALETAARDQSARILDYYARRSDDMSVVVSVLTQTGVRARALGLVRRCRERSTDAVRSSGIAEASRAELETLITELLAYEPLSNAGTVTNP